MISGIGKIRTQVGGRGKFALVELCLEPCASPDSVRMADNVESWEGDRYLPAVTVGVEYAWLSLLLAHKDPPRLQVKVRRLLTKAVDTTPMLVVYTAAEAFFQALGHDPSRFMSLQPETHRVTFCI